MTEKRFENRLDKSNMKFNTLNPVWDNKKEDALNVFKMIDLLNDFQEENEQLKQSYIQLRHRHSLLHDVCLDAECERDSLKKDVESLEKENERLKHRVEFFKALAEGID